MKTIKRKNGTGSVLANLAGMTLLVAIVVALSVAPANASVIVQPSEGDMSTTVGSVISRTAITTINGDGLDSTATTNTGDPVPATWPGHTTDAGNDTDTNNGDASMWLSDNATVADQWVMYDLGENYTLDGMRVWNYNESAGSGYDTRGTQTLNLKFATSLTGTFGSTDENDSGWDTATTMTLAKATGSASYTGETKTFSQVTARYVLFDVQTGYGNATDYVGLSEVRFTAIPEPTSLALLGLGGLALLSGRRRRRS